ncbi:MAG: rod shape-determining protein MreC, partial [Candidatus Cloacimonetes bacterium]|nr:rod shape-determining protein MreC [Candidatus Cloacimonadota bacterium]
LIGELMVKNIKQETLLNKFRDGKIDFAMIDTTIVLADVVGFSGDFFGRTIIISKGLIHGVRANNPVFASKGIVGKVIIAYQNFSVILPLDHPNFKIAVLNKNSGVQGILTVDMYSTIAMSYMRFGSHIAVGDTIVTSNLSHIFPANYPVGSIIRLEESTDALYLRAVMKPFNEISNLQHVYVLLKEDLVIDEIDIETNY